jgi:hypothetical protein
MKELPMSTQYSTDRAQHYFYVIIYNNIIKCMDEIHDKEWT